VVLVITLLTQKVEMELTKGSHLSGCVSFYLTVRPGVIRLQASQRLEAEKSIALVSHN